MTKRTAMNKPAVVYSIVCGITGEMYIGATTMNLNDRRHKHFSEARIRKHRGGIAKAIRKYGEKNFTFFILEEFDTFREALLREIEMIAALRPKYNLTKGGVGCTGRKMEAHAKKCLRDRNKKTGWGLNGKAHHLKKKVLCVDDNVVYESASAAAKAYGFSIAAVSAVCAGTYNGKGLGKYRWGKEKTFVYVDSVKKVA